MQQQMPGYGMGMNMGYDMGGMDAPYCEKNMKLYLILGVPILFAFGVTWLWAGLPRFVRPRARPFIGVALSQLGVLAIPPLYVVVAGLWLVSTPGALTSWFSVSWALLWLVCSCAAVVLLCPKCGNPFHRRGMRLRIASVICAHCGQSPFNRLPALEQTTHAQHSPARGQ